MLQTLIRMSESALPALLAVLIGTGTAPVASAGGACETCASRARPTVASAAAETYLAEITARGPYKVGQQGSVTVSLTAKAGFHINDQYPYRFKTEPPTEGVSYPKPVLERADAQLEEKTAVFELPLVARRSGQFMVGGVLNLSVCSATSCVVHKERLDVTITVR
jgi:hypothetical protein